MPKATNGVKKLRIRQTYELLLSDTPKADIVRYGSENWGVTERQVEKYMHWATDVIEAESAAMQAEAFGQALAKLKAMRHSALKPPEDPRLAFDITKDINKLLNLYPAKERKVTNLDIDLGQLTDDQLQRIAQGEDPASVMVDK